MAVKKSEPKPEPKPGIIVQIAVPEEVKEALRQAHRDFGHIFNTAKIGYASEAQGRVAGVLEKYP
jgi:hypothetical protein